MNMKRNNSRNQNAIEILYKYFKNQVNIIEDLSSANADEYDLNLHKETLFVSILDSLSNYRFNQKNYPELYKQNRIRFVRFLKEFAEWPEGELVSIPFLKDSLPQSCIKNPLYEFLENQNIGEYPKGESILCETIDFKLEELLELSITQIEENAIFFNQHFSIIYRYRNYLIHEARIPGKAMQFMDYENDKSIYHSFDNDSTLHLLYPIKLFRKLVLTSLKNFRTYFRTKNLNPYEYLNNTTRF